MSSDAASHSASGGASAAGLNAYVLGTSQHSEADAKAAEAVLSLGPSVREHLTTLARESQEFLTRAIHHLVQEKGIVQFIDFGFSANQLNELSLHRAAKEAAAEAGLPGVWIAYVDNTPTTYTTAALELAEDESIIFLDVNPLTPARALADPRLERHIDFSKPVCVIMFSFLHYVSDADDPRGVVNRVMRHVAPGSHLVAHHVTSDGLDPVLGAHVRQLFNSIGTPMHFRSQEEFEKFFGELELLEPGVVDTADWRGRSLLNEPHPLRALAAVGRKR
ncbi:SAM-dependent methyltransferase [Planomonospora sp. ID91781]|uniref:SAM-dependent methyltransferase n=1 Tax=Planomonospora sp. ID91781 TaxID=2738135 RepID=UPI0018C3BDD2|nr:SAM-dependent methyltransferase [Planomonospora sp. ID91781]MBG0825894.1 SAM-dependent methyltransferase [Planomonospora sp. ID91781]